jgi:hypothetical protein
MKEGQQVWGGQYVKRLRKPEGVGSSSEANSIKEAAALCWENVVGEETSREETVGFVRFCSDNKAVAWVSCCAL